MKHRQYAACHHCSLSHLRVRHCVHLVGCPTTPRTSRVHILTTGPGLSDSDRQKNVFFLALPSLSGVSRGTRTKASNTREIFSRFSSVWTGRRAHGSPFFFAVRTDQGVRHACTSFSFFTRIPGFVHDGQPTMILQVSFRIRTKKEKKEEKEKNANL